MKILLSAAALTLGAAGFFFFVGSNQSSPSGHSAASATPSAAPAGHEGSKRSTNHGTLAGGFGDILDETSVDASTVVVVLPEGVKTTVLDDVELASTVRLPASLVATAPALQLTPEQEAEKQKIARQFLETLAAARGATANPSATSGWQLAQRMADERLRSVLGAEAFALQSEKANPGVTAAAATQRRQQQQTLIESLQAPSQPTDASAIPPTTANLPVPILGPIDPSLRRPASIVATAPSLNLTPQQEAQKQTIAADFRQTVSLIRSTGPDTSISAADWQYAQNIADERLRTAIGAPAFDIQSDQANPGALAAATLRRQQQNQKLIESYGAR